ncbi:MAG: hypothetical protein AB8C02_18755 [Halioglobus sp.]
MKLEKVTRRLGAAILWVAMVAPGAHAGLIGDEINATWTFPPFYTDSNTFVASDGLDLMGSWGLTGDLDVKDLSIEALTDSTTGIGRRVSWLFQGLDIDIVDAFVVTNYAGWDDSFFEFGAGFAAVNFLRDVSFAEDDNYFEIFFEVDNQAPVPLPGSLPLVMLGLSALLIRARFRGQCSA